MESQNTWEVKIETESICTAADAASLARIPSPFKLGPFDYQSFLVVPIAVVFVYAKPPNEGDKVSASLSGPLEDSFMPISRIKRAIEMVLNYYPHLTGRLQRNERDKAVEVGKIGSGALLLGATCNRTLQSFQAGYGTRLQQIDLPDGGNALLPPYVPVEEEICKRPVLAIQHTRFACGGVALGVRLPHILCDAQGFFQFYRDLADLYRQLRSIDLQLPDAPYGVRLSNQPVIASHMSDLPEMTEQERIRALQYETNLLKFSDGSVLATDSVKPAVEKPKVLGRVLRFEPDELNALKKKAQPAGSNIITTFDALAGHLCQRIFHARLLDAKSRGVQEEEIPTTFLAPVNMRGRKRWRLPDRYFPNALVATFFPITRETLKNGSLCEVAQEIHDQLRKMDPTSLGGLLNWIRAQPDKSCLVPGFPLDNSIFMASQWTRFDIYVGTHFDTRVSESFLPDLPVLVAAPFTPVSLVDGLSYFLPTEMQSKQSLETSSSMNEASSSIPSSSSSHFNPYDLIWDVTLNPDAGSPFDPAARSPQPTTQQPLDLLLTLSEPIWHLLDQDPSFRGPHGVKTGLNE